MRNGRFVVVFLLVLGVLLAACGVDDDSGGAGATSPVGRTFLSSAVTGRDLLAGTQVRLTFGDDGRLGAYAGCNHLGGAFTLEGGILAVDGMHMTEMGCDAPRHAQDEWLAGFLGARPRWALDGATLTLTGDGATITLVDREVADPDRPLEGTRWTVDTIVDGTAASSVVGEPYLEFSGGSVTGSTGCNGLSGDAEIVGEIIRFHAISLTEMVCGPEATAVQDAVLAVLSGEVRYEIEAGRLTLTPAGGTRGLGLRADP